MATAASPWLPAVPSLTGTSPPRGLPAASYRRAKTPSPTPSWLASVQATTKSPSASTATSGSRCSLAVVVLTANSGPRALPAESKRRA
jgi:hypothetical protein